MKKGQAFDTFKLMIAAVIAVAILGILLAILNQIRPPGTEFQHAAPALLKEVAVNEGLLKSSGGDVTFVKDEIFRDTIFSAQAQGRAIIYVVNPDLESAGLVELDGGSLEIKRDFSKKIYACCDAATCEIGIGTPDLNC